MKSDILHALGWALLAGLLLLPLTMPGRGHAAQPPDAAALGPVRIDGPLSRVSVRRSGAPAG